MNTSYFRILINFVFISLLLSGCTMTGKKSTKVFKHDTPLIKTDVKSLGKKELETNTVSVRARDKGNIGNISIDQFNTIIKDEPSPNLI